MSERDSTTDSPSKKRDSGSNVQTISKPASSELTLSSLPSTNAIQNQNVSDISTQPTHSSPIDDASLLEQGPGTSNIQENIENEDSIDEILKSLNMKRSRRIRFSTQTLIPFQIDSIPAAAQVLQNSPSLSNTDSVSEFQFTTIHANEIGSQNAALTSTTDNMTAHQSSKEIIGVSSSHGHSSLNHGDFQISTQNTTISSPSESIVCSNAREIDTVPEAILIDTVPEAMSIDTVPEAIPIDTIPEAMSIDTVPEAIPIDRMPEGVSIPRMPVAIPIYNAHSGFSQSAAELDPDFMEVKIFYDMLPAGFMLPIFENYDIHERVRRFKKYVSGVITPITVTFYSNSKSNSFVVENPQITKLHKNICDRFSNAEKNSNYNGDTLHHKKNNLFLTLKSYIFMQELKAAVETQNKNFLRDNQRDFESLSPTLLTVGRYSWPLSYQSGPRPKVQELERVLNGTEIRDLSNCAICLEENVGNVLLEPCKHYNMCSNCWKKIGVFKCPICRAVIDNVTIYV